jgi:CubicO group peptidase (beta-lactamase class C family)
MEPDLPAAALSAFLAELVAAGAATAAVGLVGDARGILWQGGAGEARPGVAATSETRFDFASLTKPFVATLALALDASGRLALGRPVGSVFPQAGAALRRRSLGSLLRHRSGLVAWIPLRTRGGSLEEIEALLISGELATAAQATYSDLGYLLWAWAVERACAAPLAALLGEHVFAPLAVIATPPPGDRPDVAVSAMGTGEEVRLAGELGLVLADLGPPPAGMPQDGNARFLYDLGVALPGHAGLFGTARDLWRLGAEWLIPGTLLEPGAVRRALGGGGPYALGWWRRQVESGGGGAALSPRSFGSTGFAGGNLWIDPVAGRIYVLLAARSDPTVNLNLWRRRFHALAAGQPS